MSSKPQRLVDYLLGEALEDDIDSPTNYKPAAVTCADCGRDLTQPRSILIQYQFSATGTTYDIPAHYDTSLREMPNRKPPVVWDERPNRSLRDTLQSLICAHCGSKSHKLLGEAQEDDIDPREFVKGVPKPLDIAKDFIRDRIAGLDDGIINPDNYASEAEDTVFLATYLFGDTYGPVVERHYELLLKYATELAYARASARDDFTGAV